VAGAGGTAGVRGKGPAVDILCNEQTNRKAWPLMEALQRGGVANGFDARLVDHQHIRAGSWLFLYGLGGPDRVQYASREKLVAFDLAYWERKGVTRKYRVSVGGFHSPDLVMLGPSPGPKRWAQSGLAIAATGGELEGPVLLVGNGPKSTAIGANGWARDKSRELKRAGLRVWYRPKPGKPLEDDVYSHAVVRDDPIDDVLAKVSLVVCRHSNVAVDACRLGVPVVCEDGAAASIYPRDLNGAQPDLATRTEFLHRLAWWQWSPAECETPLFWNWIKGQMGAT
jgi:hypothetical protein